ncbi:MAG: glycosyltransferase, partial [Thiomargarita sp.]|nr:glycosyltransferase [Thiomargarita sp.]
GYVMDDSNLELDYLQNIKIIRCGGKKLIKYHHLKHQKRISNHPYYYFLGLKYIWFMDFCSAWYFETKDEILQIAQQEGIDCVYTTSPPHSTHLLGYHLKKELGLPWIMDLRDSMVEGPVRQKTLILWLQAQIEKIYEKKFYVHSDNILTVSQPMLDNIIRRTGLPLENKGTVIHNGFDQSDFDQNSIVINKKTGRLVITYTGTLQAQQTSKYFCTALQLLAQQKRIQASDILVRFVGMINNDERKLIETLAKMIPVEMLGFQTHQKSLAYQMHTDVLLLVMSADNTDGKAAEVMTGKVFEYLGAKRPIFALVPNGSLKNLIIKGNFGFVVPPNDCNAIADGFETIYHDWKKNKGKLSYSPNNTVRDRYTRKGLSQKLATVVKEVMQQS